VQGDQSGFEGAAVSPLINKAVSNLIYKDYFTADEAADYCCVSRAFFDQHIRPGVSCSRIGERKLLFRRSDLQRYIEERWQLSNGAKVRGVGTPT
jgi:hypothetical protein